MNSYFRDLFIDSFPKQQLGGYDPYHNEYLLTNGDIDVPFESECIDCGVVKTYTVDNGSPLSVCYELGQLVGDTDVFFTVVSGGDVVVTATYDGDPYTSGTAAQTGGFTIDKDKPSVTTADFVITAPTTDALVELTVQCPDADELTVIQVCVTSNADAGKFVHNEYRWTDGVYISPLHSTQVEFASGTSVPLVSQYDTFTGLQGGSFIPANGATVSIRSNKIPPIDDFEVTLNVDEFRYLRSNTLYSNNPTDINNLLTASTLAAPTLGSSPMFYADFTMPTTGNYLYLIYVYDKPTVADLCFDRSVAADACCNCVAGDNILVQECREDGTVNQEVVSKTEKDVGIGDFISLVGYPDCVFEVILNTTAATTDTMDEWLQDINSCYDVCSSYTLTNTDTVAQTMEYVDCSSQLLSISLDPSEVATDICITRVVNRPAVITIAKTDCACTSPMVARQCRFDGTIVEEVIPQTTGVDVGSFVTLTSYSSDCTFEVVSYTTDATTDTVATILATTNCDDVCNTYRITNPNPFVVVVPYEDCSGLTVNISIPPKDNELICARRLITALPPLVTATWQTCGCSA
jgi:hypothetical protein